MGWGGEKCINHFTKNKRIIQDLTIYLEYVQQSRYLNLIYIKLSIHFDIQFLLESSKIYLQLQTLTFRTI